MIQILNDIRAGLIAVREIHVDILAHVPALPVAGGDGGNVRVFPHHLQNTPRRQRGAETGGAGEAARRGIIQKWERRKLPENEEQPTPC